MSSIDTFYDDVVIDIPPGDGPDQRVALREADRIIVPIQPGIFDMWTVTLVDERVAEALEDRPDLKVWFVLNLGETAMAFRERRRRTRAWRGRP